MQEIGFNKVITLKTVPQKNKNIEKKTVTFLNEMSLIEVWK